MAKGFKRKYFSLAAITATISLITLSAEASSVVALQKVVVSATKEKDAIKYCTDDIEIITAKEIEQRGIKRLKELLSYIGSTAIVSNGGAGKTTSLYLRGMDNDKVLILIDGVRFNDPSNFNGPSIEHLFLSNIDRVEIIKGSQSGIWGADAASGVINIVTKQSLQKFGSSLYIEKGSFDTKNFKATLFKRVKNLFYNFSFNYFQTDGFSAVTLYNKNPKDFERDGYINRSFQTKIGYLFDSAKIEVGGYLINAANEADGYSPITFQLDPNSKNDNRFNYYNYFLNGKYFFKSHNITFHIDKTKTQREFLDTTYGVKKFKGETKNIEIRDRFDYSENSYLQFGVEYQKFKSFCEEVDDNAKVIDYYSKGIYLVNRNIFGKLTILENIRYESYDNFDDQITGKIGIKYKVFGNFKVFSNFATAYNPPNQIKILNPWGRSNYKLEPEKTKSFDIGFEIDGLKFVYFKNSVKDLINWYDPDPTVWQDEYYKNFSGKSRFKGVEITYKKNLLENLILKLGFTYLSAKDSNNQDLPRRAKSKYDYFLTWYPSSKHTIEIFGHYIGTRYNDLAKTRQTGKYNVTNISLSHQFAKHFKGYIKIDNIFNRRYQEVFNYATSSRALYVGISMSY